MNAKHAFEALLVLLVINLTGLLNFGHRLNTQGLPVADKPHNYSRPLVCTWSSTAGAGGVDKYCDLRRINDVDRHKLLKLDKK